MAKCVVLFNGPTLTPFLDSDFDGLLTISLNWAARRRRFRCDWWVTHLVQPCDMKLASAAGGVKIAANVGRLGAMLAELGGKIDADLRDVRQAVGRDPNSMDTVADALALARYLRFYEVDVYGWDVPRFKSRREWDATVEAVESLQAGGMTINRIGYPSHRQASLKPHPETHTANLEAIRIANGGTLPPPRPRWPRKPCPDSPAPSIRP